MNRLLFILLFTFFICQFFSQSQGKFDSLQKVIQVQTDTSKAASLIRLGWKYFNIGDYASAKKHLINAGNISTASNFKLGIANSMYIRGLIELYQSNYSEGRKLLLKAEGFYLAMKHEENITSVYNAVGVAYFREGDYENALEYYEKALKINERINKKTGIAASLTNIGGVYFIQGKIAQALDYNFRSLKIEKEIGNKRGESESLTTIGIMYNHLLKHDKAIEYFNQSLQINRAIGNKAGIENCFLNIGNVHQSMASIEFAKVEEGINEPNKSKELIELHCKNALEYYTKALPLCIELGNKSGAITVQGGLGKVHALRGEQKLALDFFLTALKNSQEINDQANVCVYYNNIAKSYFEMKNYEGAIEYCNLALELAKKMNDLESIGVAEHLLSKIYIILNNAPLALQHYKNLKDLKDSVYDVENRKNIAEISAKYETEIKEKENKELTLANQVQQLELNKNKYFIFGLLTLLLLCIAIAYIIIVQNKLKHSHKSIQLEQKLLRSQMNPHFIFNALTAIESFIYKNEPKAAGKYLSGFATLMRLILDNSREDYVTLEKEINTLEHYLTLQKLRYNNSFSYSIIIDENIDETSITIPPMLAQPFIENSIEHGLKNLDKQGEIILNFFLKDNELVFEARDNGIGFEKSMSIKSKEITHKSMATTITIERLKNLNRNKSKKIKWIAEDLKDQINNVLGTRVVFTIPYREA